MIRRLWRRLFPAPTRAKPGPKLVVGYKCRHPMWWNGASSPFWPPRCIVCGVERDLAAADRLDRDWQETEEALRR